MVTTRTEKVYLFSGLSSDEKPIGQRVGNGSLFIEMDTSKIFIYSEEAQTWTPFSISGGGGGATEYTAGKNITISEDHVISASYGLDETLVAGLNVGGVEKGDVFEAGTNIEDVIKAILIELSPVEGTVYYGALNNTSPDVQSLHSIAIPPEIKSEGITLSLTTTGQQYQCIVYPKELGLLTKIVQNGMSDFNLLDSFDRTEMTVEDKEYYCYCTNELALEESGADYTFLFNENI